MARFIGYVQGNRGETHRLGSKASGIRTDANGWRSGVKVRGYVDADGKDVFRVYATAGSGYGDGELIAVIWRDGNGKLVKVVGDDLIEKGYRHPPVRRG